MLDLLKGLDARVAARNLKEHELQNRAQNSPKLASRAEEVVYYHSQAIKTALARLGKNGRKLWRQGKLILHHEAGEWIMEFHGYKRVPMEIRNEAREARPCGQCAGCKEVMGFSFTFPDACDMLKHLPMAIQNPEYDKHVRIGKFEYPVKVIDYRGPVRHLDRSDKVPKVTNFKKISPKQKLRS